MPILGALVLGIFTWLASFFGRWLTKKVAFGSAAVGSFGVLTVGLYTAMSVLLNICYAYSFPSFPGIATAMYIGIPPGGPVVLSAVLAYDAALGLYRWNVENLKLVSYIT